MIPRCFSGHVFLLRRWKTLSVPSPGSPPTSCYRRLSLMSPRGFPDPLYFMSPGKSMPSCSHLREYCTTTASFRGNREPPLPLCTTELNRNLRNFLLSLGHLFTPVFLLYTCFSAQKESTKKVNMKRENKAYSYKEQIIELELQEVVWSYYQHCSLVMLNNIVIIMSE